MSQSDATQALGRMNSALGAVTLAIADAMREAERREREADRRERAAAATITDAERRVADLEHALAQEREHRDTGDYRRGYHAGRAAALRGDNIDPDEAVRRRRVRAVR